MVWEVYPAQQSGTWALIMPAYNEQAALGDLLQEWHEVVAARQGEIILLNDGSRDQTFAVALDLQKKYPALTVINKTNSGHGETCRLAYQWAIENGKTWIFQTDSDRQTIPQEFCQIWEERQKYDFIFGQRRARGDGQGRVLVSWVLRVVIWSIFRIWVLDANVPFRLMKAEKLAALLPLIPPRLFLANAFLTVLIQKRYGIHWVPISFVPRQTGVPSVAWGRFIKVGWQVVREFWALRRIK